MSWLNHCRICLEDGATLPIFDKYDEKENIQMKLSICFREKVEAIDNYPSKICNKCYEALNIVYDFVKKYEESSKILESALLLVKKENEIDDKGLNNGIREEEIYSETEIEINVKEELAQDYTDSINIEFEPILLQLKKRPTKKQETCKRILKRTTNLTATKTNNTASCLLEGVFTWTGEQWRLTSAVKDLPPVTDKVLVKRQPPIKIKKIKVKKEKKTKQPKLCDLCGDVFKDQDKLVKHRKRKHLWEKATCQHCSKVYASEYQLKKHIRRQHEENQPHACETCGKRYTFLNEMKKHENAVHKKHLITKKQHPCSLCDKKFNSKKCLLIHERSAHTGIRPYNCTECSSAFFDEDYLKQHMRLHTGETPFKCPVCGRGYAQLGNMKSHLRIHRISQLDASTLAKIKPSHMKFLKP